MRQHYATRTLRPSLLTACIALACAGAAPMVTATPAVNALPILNNIAYGTASLSTAANQLTVDQSTDKLIANWNSFNVGSAAKVQFNQPAASSTALNRISGSASEIFGRVTANGQLILVNPAGITFGSTAQVNAASVIASTLNLSDSNFLSDNFLFERVSSGGKINNQGSVLGNEGNTVVLAGSIKNSGTLRARGGNLSLANGNKVTVDNSNGQVTVNQIASVASLIQSTGSLRADRLVTTADQGKIFIVGDRARTGSVVELAGQLTSLNNDIQGKTINMSGDLTANAATVLNALNAVNINANFTQNKNSSLLNLTYGSADGLNFGTNGKISLSGTAMQYKANNVSYQIIQTLAQLQALDSNATTRSGKYVLGLDIDASSTASSGFNPIGSSISTPFSGVLDGLGHQIDQLNINKPAKDGVGLFGYALYTTIKNLNLTNASIIGKNAVGGLIGYNGNNNGSTGNSWIINSSVSGSLIGYNQLGGLIGSDTVYNTGSSSIIGSRSNSTITGRYTQIGGLVGYAIVDQGNLNISNSQTNSTVQASTIADSKNDIGGLVGRLDLSNQASASLSNLDSNGTVTTLSRPAFNVGGIVGTVNNSDATLTLDHVNNHSNVSAIQQVATSTQAITSAVTGGLIGQLTSSGLASSLINASSNTGNITGLNQVGGLIGYSSGGVIQNSYNSGNINGYIQNTGGLIGQNVNTAINSSYNSGVIAGLGGNYTYNMGGLVGYNDNGVISDSYNTGKVGSGGAWFSGGIVGRNLHASITNSFSTGNVTGISYVGGLAGYNSALISHSYATGNIDVGRNSYIGGLVGENEGGTIEYSHASGNVSGAYESMGGLVGLYKNGNIRHSYATGDVTGGTSSFGGLIGFAIAYTPEGAGSSSYDISDSYATGNISGGIFLGGLIGQLSVGSNATLTLANNYVTGNVTKAASYSGTGYQIGGLLGYVTISDTSTLNVMNNYSAGQVSGVAGTTSIGAFIGSIGMDAGTTDNISNNYWNSTTAGQALAIGNTYSLQQPVVNLTGLTASQMTQQSSFVGWDISSQLNGSNSIWYINNGVSAPVLRSFLNP